jgi:hypothetical protein
LKQKEIAVGDSTELEIIFLTGKRNGAQTKSPTIQTNEGPPQRRVTIKATVIQQPDSTYPITIKPHRLYVSKLDSIEIDEAVFTVSNISDADLGVKVVGQPPGYFQVDIPEKVKAGEKAECTLKVNPEYLAGAFEKSITIELDDTAQTRFTIPVARKIHRARNSGKPEGSGSPKGGQ